MTTSDDGYSLREAGPTDADVLIAQRRQMWFDMGQQDRGLLDAMCERYRPWMLAEFAEGRYFAWLVECEGVPIAGAAVWLRPRLPGFTVAGDVGFVCNVYTDPGHRRRRLARRLMEHIIARAPRMGLDTLELAPSNEGRPLYLGLGFETTGELRLRL